MACADPVPKGVEGDLFLDCNTTHASIAFPPEYSMNSNSTHHGLRSNSSEAGAVQHVPITASQDLAPAVQQALQVSTSDTGIGQPCYQAQSDILVQPALKDFCQVRHLDPVRV